MLNCTIVVVTLKINFVGLMEKNIVRNSLEESCVFLVPLAPRLELRLLA